MRGSEVTTAWSLAPRVALAPVSALPNDGRHDWLGAAERERLQRISSLHRRQQFLAGHWLTRELVARCSGGASESWEITSTPEGAPLLVSRAGGTSSLRMSLSHSGDWVVCAIASAAVGVDLETSRQSRRWRELAEQVLSPVECRRLQDLPEEALEAAFHLHWTIKEAWGKRDGQGLRADVARRQTAWECAPEAAQVITWQSTGRCLALACGTASSAQLEGWNDAPAARHWRIDSLAI